MQYLAAAAAPYAPPFIIGHRSHALIPRPSGGPGAVWHFIVMEAFGGGVEPWGELRAEPGLGCCEHPGVWGERQPARVSAAASIAGWDALRASCFAASMRLTSSGTGPPAPKLRGGMATKPGAGGGCGRLASSFTSSSVHSGACGRATAVGGEGLGCAAWRGQHAPPPRCTGSPGQ